MSLIRRFWPVIFLALLPVIPLWRCVFLGEAPGPFDQVRQMAPWHGPKPAEAWDVLQVDGVLQFYPWRDMVFKSWSHGHLPLWNPYELAGAPLLANSQSGGFYPPHIAVGLLGIPTPSGMTLMAWLHLFWAGLGVYVLCRRLGASKVGAVVSGSSFELSAFMLAWTALPSVIETVAWIPWLLVGVYSVFQNGRRGVVLAAGSTGMMILAGHLQFVAYGVMAAIFLGIWLTLAGFKSGSKPLPSCLKFGLSLIVGGLIAGPQLLPVLSYSQFSHRQNPPSAEHYQDYVAGSLKPFELANLSVPTSLGNPRTAVEVQDGLDLSSYWPQYAKRGANFAESAVTLGPLVLSLLFLVDWRDRRIWPVAAIGVIALLLALGTILNWPLYFLVPGWSSTGSPGRIVVLFVMAACVLSGTGLHREPASAKLICIATFASLALTLLFSFGFPALAPAWLPGLDVGSAIQFAASKIFLASLVATTAVALIAGLLLLPQFRKYSAAIALVPVLLMLAGGGQSLVSSGRPIPVSQSTSTERIAYVNEGWGLFSAAPAIAPPNTAYLLGQHELSGYDSLLHRDTKALLDDINGVDSAPPANGNMMFIKPNADRAKLADAGVNAILAAKSDPIRLAGPGRVNLGKIEDETLSSLKVKGSGPGRLVVRDRNMPGWSAKVDGKPQALQGAMWRELDLPPGEHQIEFAYDPPGLKLGLFLGIPAWIGLIFLGARSLRRA